MSDAQTDGMFPTRSEREAAEREKRERELKLQERKKFLTSIKLYLQRPGEKRLGLALRNLKKKWPKKVSDLLEGLRTQDETIWAQFLSQITEDEWFEKFKKLSPFRTQVIGIGVVGFSEITFKMNPGLTSHILGRRVASLDTVPVLFDKGSKIRTIEVLS